MQLVGQLLLLLDQGRTESGCFLQPAIGFGQVRLEGPFCLRGRRDIQGEQVAVKGRIAKMRNAMMIVHRGVGKRVLHCQKKKKKKKAVGPAEFAVFVSRVQAVTMVRFSQIEKMLYVCIRVNNPICALAHRCQNRNHRQSRHSDSSTYPVKSGGQLEFAGSKEFKHSNGIRLNGRMKAKADSKGATADLLLISQRGVSTQQRRLKTG